MAEPDSVRVEICFDGGQILGATVTVQGADELERRLSTDQGGTLMLDASRVRDLIARAPILR